jgi:hypothetical protein
MRAGGCRVEAVKESQLRNLGFTLLELISRPALAQGAWRRRLPFSEEVRELFVQFWIQDFALTKQGAIKRQTLLLPLAVPNVVISPDSATGFAADIAGDEK